MELEMKFDMSSSLQSIELIGDVQIGEGFYTRKGDERIYLVAQTVRNPLAMQEIWVLSLGWEDPLEKGMATHPSILAWEIPWTEEPGGLQSMGLQRVGHNWATNTHTHKGDENKVKKSFLPCNNFMLFCAVNI